MLPIIHSMMSSFDKSTLAGVPLGNSLLLESDKNVEENGSITSWATSGGQQVSLSPTIGGGLTLIQNQINGFPVVRGDGTDGLSVNLPIPFEPKEFFVVAKHNRVGSFFDRVFAFASGSVRGIEITSSSSSQEAYKLQSNNSSDQIFQVGFALQQDVFNLLGGEIESLNKEVRSTLRFNTLEVANGNISNFLSDSVHIMERSDDLGQSPYDIAFLLFADRVLSQSERLKIQNYILNKYFPTAQRNLDGSPILDSNKNLTF